MTTETFDHYPDTGCLAGPSCLACPLPLCRHDDEAGYLRAIRQNRDVGIVAMVHEAKDAGKKAKVARVARDLGVTERTVYRTLLRVATEGTYDAAD
jgi:hypothetical protein|tara:strand:+ start:3881 stop:4168 length:288 start_codon:yes stop_codon:yes gene_type:complete